MINTTISCSSVVTVSQTRIEFDGALCTRCGFWLKEVTPRRAVRRMFIHAGKPIQVEQIVQ